MQTFIPLPSFVESAKVLDRTRLGNQRNEAKIILKCLLDPMKKVGEIILRSRCGLGMK